MLAQGFTACETVDFGDINENRNGPSEVYPAGLLSGAIETYSTMTGRDPFLKPTLFVQYQSQVTYTDEMLYAEAPSSWDTYYARILPALNQVIDYNLNEANHDPALLAQGDPANQAGVAMIMRGIVMKRVTDTWGDVPYSEAFKGLENLTPAYDKQEDVYRKLIDDIKAGRDMLDVTKAGPIGDIIYDGGIAQWQRLANSVLLQATLQLSEVSSSKIDAKAEFLAALQHPAGVIDDPILEEAWYKFDAVTEFQNPFNPNRPADYFLSAEFVDALQGDKTATSLNPTSNATADYRINVYAKSATAEGVPYGYNDASGSGKNQVSTRYLWNATAPLPLMTASYTYFNRAEAAQRGWTSENAADMLTKGITSSFESLEAHYLPLAQKITGSAGPVEVAKISAVSEAGPAYAAARLADAQTVGMLQVIAEEKWKSLFPQGFDAWAEWRRTGYPDLTPAADALNDGQIVRRYLYPVDERTLNAKNYTDAVGRLSPSTDKNTSRVWWDVE